VPAVSDTQAGAAFPRGIAREVTPLGLWGGDALIYKSIIVLAGLAMPAIAGMNWYLRGTVSWPQLAMAGAVLAGALLCFFLSRSGRREIAAAMLIGVLWSIATIYAFKSGYGMHSAAVFIYLPCVLYTALFFGLAIASAELALTVAALVLMYLAEESGRLGGAAEFAAQRTNFNFLIGVILTSIGTLIVSVVYHRRVEREAARVVAEAEQRRDAMEQAQLAQAQLETANAKLQALNGELALQARLHERETVRARRDIDLFHDVAAKDLPASLQALRTALAAPDDRTEALLQREIEHMTTVAAALEGLGRRGESALARVPLDLSSLAREAAGKPRADGSSAQVRFDIDANLRAEGDRRQVAALLHHLIKRAVTACRAEPEPLVHIGGGSLEGRSVFFVSDNGPGMDEARREQLFRPFEGGRAEEDTVDIGIVSARRIAERHGGDLFVESAPGKGTTFFFTLSAA